MGIDILGIDVLGIDILGIDILAIPHLKGMCLTDVKYYTLYGFIPEQVSHKDLFFDIYY